MTSHYIDLAVVPDPETTAPQLMGILHEKLHLALVRDHIDGIGVSFPHYSVIPKTIGTVLRIHGTENLLQALMGTDWLKGMHDHLRIGQIAEAPHDALYRVVTRRQFKTNVERLRRRRMRRKGDTEQNAKQAIPESAKRTPGLPYVHIRSHSTGQKFCLYIAMLPVQPTAISGRFNTYGLSTHGTIPWF